VAAEREPEKPALRALVESDGWKYLAEAIDAKIDGACMYELLNSSDMVNMGRAQGWYRALNTFLEWPAYRIETLQAEEDRTR
jgi:hypothetical protein